MLKTADNKQNKYKNTDSRLCEKVKWMLQQQYKKYSLTIFRISL